MNQPLPPIQPITSPAPVVVTNPFPKWPIFILIFLLGIASVFAYQKFQPTRTLLADPSPSLNPTPSAAVAPAEEATANWKTYDDPVGNFSFNYPSTYDLDMSHITPYLNRNITWRFNKDSIKNFIGDVPFVESSTRITINGREATRFTGYIGSVGGNIPQEFITYEIYLKAKYFAITLQALPLNLTNNEMLQYDVYTKQPIKAVDAATFNLILSTFRFTDQTSIPTITSQDLEQGWYWGDSTQKKSNTPANWIFQAAGRSSCWHQPGIVCN